MKEEDKNFGKQPYLVQKKPTTNCSFQRNDRAEV